MSDKKETKIPDTQTTVSRSGHVWQVCDAPNKPYIIIAHHAGHHLWLRQDGSIDIKAVKFPANNTNSGKLIVHCEGNAQIKVNEDCIMEVGGNASLRVDGQTDLHTTGDLNLKSDSDVNINAGKNINMNASQAIGLVGASKVAIDSPEASINTDIKKENITGPQYDTIFGERTIAMTDPRGVFTLLSAGHMATIIKGDHEKIVTGRESEKILGVPPVPPLPSIPVGGPVKLSIIGATAGLGRVEKIMTGNDVCTVVAGNKITNVAAGNNVMTAAAGTVTIAAGVNATMTATANVTIAGATVFLN